MEVSTQNQRQLDNTAAEIGSGRIGFGVASSRAVGGRGAERKELRYAPPEGNFTFYINRLVGNFTSLPPPPS